MALVPTKKDLLEVGDKVMIHFMKLTKNKEKFQKQEGVITEVKEYVDPPGPSHIYIVLLDNDDVVDVARHECVFLDEDQQ